MRTQLLTLGCGVTMLMAVAAGLRADVLELQNGDRYSGQVLFVTGDTVVLKSEILGKVNVPRSKVLRLSIGPAVTPVTTAPTKAVATPAPVASTNLSVRVAGTVVPSNNLDLAAMFRQLGADTNFIAEIRQESFMGNPQAAAKFDEMVNGLMSGQMNLSDLRRQAQASAEQLRELKRDMPEAGDSFDAYLKVLDGFLKETGGD